MNSTANIALKEDIEIFQNIGETLPYIIEPLRIINSDDNTLIVEIEPVQYQEENFSSLIQIMCTYGSICLQNKLDSTGKNKHYFLAEKVRISHFSELVNESTNILEATAVVTTKRLGSARIEIRNTNSETCCFGLEVDYNILKKATFETLYKGYKTVTPPAAAIPELPESKIIEAKDGNLTIEISKFTKEHCSGHFNNFPIVPAVYITNRIIKSLLLYIRRKNQEKKNIHYVDNIELFLTKAMPVDTVFYAHISESILLKNIVHFQCSVSDMEGTVYGHYYISIKMVK